MKRFLPILLVLLLAGCAGKQTVRTITVSNSSEDYRLNEPVTIPLDSLHLTRADFSKLVLLNEEGEELPYQVVDYPATSLLFLATTKAMFTSSYTLVKGKPAPVDKRVSARFVPERKDDFAWENEYAAYRMYGPALAPENPSNGVDLWLKCTNELIVDSFYYREHELHLPYHVNYGKGLDCYKVGHTAGCGGWFPIMGGEPQVGGQYDEWEILSEGPLSVTFRLTYHHYPIAALDSLEAQAQVTITCTSAQQLCKAEVDFNCPIDAETTINMAAGIFLHDATANADIPVAGVPQMCVNGGYLAYAENAVADAGDAQGRNYAAIVMDNMDQYTIVNNTLIGVSEETSQFTYLFGGGWSNGQYPTDEEWFAATAYSARLMREPSTWHVE